MSYLHSEELAVAALAFKVNYPVCWLEDPREHLLASQHASASGSVLGLSLGRLLSNTELQIAKQVSWKLLREIIEAVSALTREGRLIGVRRTLLHLCRLQMTKHAA